MSKIQRVIEAFTIAVTVCVVLKMNSDFMINRLFIIFLLLSDLWLYVEVSSLRKQLKKRTSMKREATTVESKELDPIEKI